MFILLFTWITLHPQYVFTLCLNAKGLLCMIDCCGNFWSFVHYIMLCIVINLLT